MRIEIKRIIPETRTFPIRRGKYKRIVDRINRDPVIKWLKWVSEKYRKEYPSGSGGFVLDNMLSQRVDEIIKKDEGKVYIVA